MFVYATRFHKKPAIFMAILVVLLMVGLLFWHGGRTTQEPQQTITLLDTDQARLEYLEAMGWQVAQEPLETLQFLLPNPLTLAYLTYNELQLAQGFDLTAYAGLEVTRYTYGVENYPNRTSGVQLNLYLHQGVPIAGDIICPGADGFQASLVYPSVGEG